MQQTVERQQKKQKRKAEESQLHVKRQEMDKVKVSFGGLL
jgi:SWI/SNF-related matrix-associated actin-dependent regulator of chromatin subfamily A member 5